jgi:TetR/AcrR family transcriptional regulator, fatty acid biosynthesis regulator
MPSRALSRDESKAITRRRLLDAAAQLLGEVGYGGMSTGAVARAAGVAQPTFYVHFRDMDDLLRTLGTEQIDALRARLRAARQALITGQRGVDAVRETFRVPLDAWIQNAGLFRLYGQEFHHPTSPMGKLSRELHAELHADLVDDLTRLGLPSRTAPERERIAMMAEAMIAQTEALARGYVDGRYKDVDALVDVLTRFAVGVLTLEGALPST